MEWTQQVCLDLIDAFRNYELLWNPNHEHYYNPIQKESAWDTIAESLACNTDDCKKKIESLKGSYRREKSRTRKTLRNGQIYNSKWFAYKAMKFLDTKSKPNKKVEIKEAVSDTDDFIWELGSTEAAAETIIKTEYKPRTSKTQTKRSFEEDPRSNEIYLKEFVADTEPPKDECAAFAQYVEAKLRKLDEQHQNIAQNRISNVLFEIEMSLYSNENNIVTVTSATCIDE